MRKATIRVTETRTHELVVNLDEYDEETQLGLQEGEGDVLSDFCDNDTVQDTDWDVETFDVIEEPDEDEE